MKNVNVIYDNENSPCGINFLDFKKFVEKDCRHHTIPKFHNLIWFYEDGKIAGNNLKGESLLIEDEKFEDGTYFTYCQNPEESGCQFSIMIKKDGEILEIDEIENIIYQK